MTHIYNERSFSEIAGKHNKKSSTKKKTSSPKSSKKTPPWKKRLRKEQNRLIRVKIVGKGTYGCVFKSFKIKNPRKFYAIKKIKMHKENHGVSLTSSP